MKNAVKHIDNLCVVHTDFDIWSGQTRLVAEDFKLGEGGEIPPGTFAQLGSKKICDPQKLKIFTRLKTRARRMLERYGMPFMNGFAVPSSKADEICGELDALSVEFGQVKSEFLASYDATVSEWIADNPEYGPAIRQGVLPRAVVATRIGFEYQVFMIQPINDNDATTDRLDRKIATIGRDLLDEITEEASKFFSNNLSGRITTNVSTKLTLKKIRDKVDGLSFLNSSFTSLVDLLDETLKGYEIHSQGRVVQAPFFYQVVATALILGDRRRIEDYADGVVTLSEYTDRVTPETAKSLATSGAVSESLAAPAQQPAYEPPSPQERLELTGKAVPATVDDNDASPDVSGSSSEEETPHEQLTQEDPFADLDQYFQQFFGKEALATDPEEAVSESVSSEHSPITEQTESNVVSDYKTVIDPEYAHESANADAVDVEPVAMPEFEDDDDSFF